VYAGGGEEVRIDSYMTPGEAAVWWRKEAAKDYGELSGYSMSWRKRQECSMSIKAIMDYVGPKKKKREVWKGEEVLTSWYKTGTLSRAAGGRG
jgi:hypothetical protein